MKREEFIEIFEGLYLSTEEICDMLVKLEDENLNILTHYFRENDLYDFPKSGWYCNITDQVFDKQLGRYVIKESCKVFGCHSMRDAIVECICKKFNLEM